MSVYSAISHCCCRWFLSYSKVRLSHGWALARQLSLLRILIFGWEIPVLIFFEKSEPFEFWHSVILCSPSELCVDRVHASQNAWCCWKVILNGAILLRNSFRGSVLVINCKKIDSIFTRSIESLSWSCIVWARDDPSRLHCFEVIRLEIQAGNLSTRATERGFWEWLPIKNWKFCDPQKAHLCMKSCQLSQRSSISVEPFP